MPVNYKQLKAIEAKNKMIILAVNPKINNESGIYFLTRTDENGFNYAYVGQAIHILNRLCSHMTGYQHIDLSLKKHKFYSDDNLCGWKINFINYPASKLDEMEQYWIKQYALKGYQLRNKTSGSQGDGKTQIDEYRPQKGYRDGLKQGFKNASREIANLFDKHLTVSTKSELPTANQRKALDKFYDFLNYYKGGGSDG